MTGRTAPALLAALLALAACGTASAPRTGQATATATPAPTATPSPPEQTPSPAPTPAPPAGLAACPDARPFSALTVLAHPPMHADDLLAMPDGTLWATDPDAGLIVHLGARGQVLQRLEDPLAPEGVVRLADGRIVIAQQLAGRLVTMRPPSPALTALFSLPPHGAAEGVDGLGYDAAGDRILIPDSPHGTLLALPASRGAATRLATGLGRPVGVAVAPDGSILVAVEGPRGLLRVPAAGGAATPLGTLSQLDDVVIAGSLAYATQVVSGHLFAIDPATGASRILVTGIGSAQGLAALPDGRLAIADSRTGTIATIAPC